MTVTTCEKAIAISGPLVAHGVDLDQRVAAGDDDPHLVRRAERALPMKSSGPRPDRSILSWPWLKSVIVSGAFDWLSEACVNTKRSAPAPPARLVVAEAAEQPVVAGAARRRCRPRRRHRRCRSRHRRRRCRCRSRRRRCRCRCRRTPMSFPASPIDPVVVVLAPDGVAAAAAIDDVAAAIARDAVGVVLAPERVAAVAAEHACRCRRRPRSGRHATSR